MENDEKEILEVKPENIVNDTNNDEIEISNDVIASIAGAAVAEVEGVASMAGGIAVGISEVFGGKKSLSKGIKIEKENGQTRIDVNIIVEYGVRIPDVAFEIQNRVKKAVETMTGLKLSGVDIHVQGINIKENKEIEEES